MGGEAPIETDLPKTFGSEIATARSRRSLRWPLVFVGVVSALLFIWIVASPITPRPPYRVALIVPDDFRGVATLQYRERGHVDIRFGHGPFMLHVAGNDVVQYGGTNIFLDSIFSATTRAGLPLRIATSVLDSPWQFPNEEEVGVWVTGFVAFSKPDGGSISDVIFVIVGNNTDYREAQSKINSTIEWMRTNARFVDP